MYSYCNNNPVLLRDSTGTRPIASATVKDESSYDRFISCDHQKQVALEKQGKIVDLTETLNNFMEENVETLKDYVEENGYKAACLYFRENVNDYGELDIKRQAVWKFDEGKTYIYNGRELRYDDPGNINFGYVGAVLFPQFVLCAGAGANQIKNYGFSFGDITTFYDDPRDNYMIKYGYGMYRGWY